MHELHNMRAFVGGSSRGIGRAIAEKLAAAGASVTLLARDERALAEVCAALPNAAGQSHGILPCDYSKPESLIAQLQQAHDQGLTADIIVNNSGGPKPGLAHTAECDDFRLAFEQHVMCNQLLLQFGLPHMKKNKFGRIINIISTSVKQPIPGLGVSNTIRGAVASWAKTVAGEVGSFGITVNNVLPGATETERLSAILAGKADREHKSLAEVTEIEKNSIPAHRFGHPGEIAEAVAFLASKRAGYVNGINLPVDGGRLTCL